MSDLDRDKEATLTEPWSERHPLDLFSLLAGIVFLGIGVALIVTESTLDSDADLGWVVAAMLIGLGLAGALGSLVRARPRREPEAVADPPDTDPNTETNTDTDQLPTQDEEVSP